MVQLQEVPVGSQAANALAVQQQRQTTLDQHPLVEFLNLQVVGQRVADMDHFVQSLQLQVCHREFAPQMQILVFEMAQIDEQSHKHLLLSAMDSSRLLKVGFRRGR